MKKELEQLREYEKEFSLLSGIGTLLHWDRATVMPPSAISQRADQIALISKELYLKSTSPEFKGLIKTLSNKKLNKLDSLKVEKHEKALKKIERIPLEHVEEMSKLITKASLAWEEAKEKSKFAIFAPYLQKIVEMRKKEAKLIDPKKHPYDVLLDDFEEGMTVEHLKKVFDTLKIGLLELFNKVKGKEVHSIHHKNFSEEGQKKITQDVIQRIIGEGDRIYQAESVHPFSNPISADDVRLTTAYDRKEPLFSYIATCHESGHALYELGFDQKLRDTSLASAPSIGLHESQSKFWECFIMKNKDWWSYYYPFFKKTYNLRADKDHFLDHLNEVKASPIRIRADEITYPLHVIIRFELEIELIEGKLKVKDLPEAWNNKYQAYLGIVPKNDSEGVLQDTHWSLGYIGYFPTYAIGVMYAASIFSKMKKDHPKLEKDLHRGDFGYVKRWLHENIHRHGSSMIASEIIKKATGKELNSDDLLDYLKGKYLA